MHPAEEPRPDRILEVNGWLIGLTVCPECGAAIVQQTTDLVDRVRQHAAWHETRP